jgi:glycosyltransferase involved in cell wall biosynthesis
MSANRPVRLLFVLTAPVRGGIEEVVLSLLARLNRAEFTPGLAAPATLLDAMRDELDACAVPTFPVAAESWLDFRGVRTLARCIRSFEPDIVNPHLFRSTLVAAPLAKWLGVRCVVETYHGREAWRRGPIRGSFLVDRVVSRFVDRVIAVSEAARDFLVTVKRIPAHKITVVPNGRDLSVFQPGCGGSDVRRELGIPADAPVLGIVGRLEEQKGHRYGIDAFAQVSKEFPEARLLIVGEGSLRGALEQQARELGVSDRVIFTGFRTDVPRLYDAMNVVVLPSLYEGMPLTAIEAAAMGKPIVATGVDGTCEVIDHGETGWLVPSEDDSAIASAVRVQLLDPVSAMQRGERARERALRRFDLTRQVARYGSLCRGALVAS